MAPIIQTEKLTHVYSPDTPFEQTAIRAIDFEAEKGEFIGIIGHTGSGKSTFIQHLNGLMKPTSGEIRIKGQNIWESKEKTRKTRFEVGLVFQYPEYQLFEETVYKDMAFGPKNMGLSEKEIDARVREAAAFSGVGEALFEKSPFALSGGQKRRVAIAGVIAMRPEVLILDEPTAGLDPSGRDDILQNIKAYHEAAGATVILVTHSMEEIAKYATRLVVFNGGKIEMNGTVAEVFARAERLSEIGLSVPQVTQVAQKLREMGLPIRQGLFTTEQAVAAILALKGGGPHA